jgi:hypothetical protein
MNYLRQLDILPPEKLAFPLVVIGAGAIGSAAVVTLAKMGCSDVTVWDDDLLEEVNVPNQLCKASAVGSPKVEALKELVEELTGTTIRAEHREYQGQRLQGVVIAAVDSMGVRKAIWKRVRLNFQVPLFLDARMGAEFARLYALRPTDLDAVGFYETNLYSSEEAEPLPCSGRSIAYCPTVVGGMIAALIARHARGKPVPLEMLVDLRSFQLLWS